MKILCVSDNVLPQMEDSKLLRKNYEGVDLCISCGDMPAPYLEYIVEVLNVPLFYVRGNHDQDYTVDHPGGENLHRRVVKYMGLRFAGLEGSIRYNNGDVQYTDWEMSMLVYQMAPGVLFRRSQGKHIDVFVAHSPPWQIHDIPTDAAHRGFRSFRRMIEWYQPRYLLHGHVHTWDNRKTTVTKFGNCEVVNINPVKVLTIE